MGETQVSDLIPSSRAAGAISHRRQSSIHESRSGAGRNPHSGSGRPGRRSGDCLQFRYAMVRDGREVTLPRDSERSTDIAQR